MGVPSEILVDRLRRGLEPRQEILEAYLFGSSARGDAAAHSDVDVAVYLAEEPESPYGYEAELTADLMRRTRTSSVDVVVLNRASPLLYHRVLRDGMRLLSRDLADTTRREGYALSRYCDFALQLAKVDAAFGARVRRGSFGR